MPWVAVDRDGTEKIFNGIPVRREEVAKSLMVDLYRKVRRAYSKNSFNKWASMWSSDINDPLPEAAIELPKGTIKKLIGRELSWKDEPVELKEE